MSAKILITGGAGFIGSHLADALIKKGHKVVVVDDLSGSNKQNLNSKATFYQMDVCSPSLAKIFAKEKPSVVYHFAAKISVRESVANPIEDADTNILGSINVLENCAKHNVKKVVFASTGGAIYGEAQSIPTKESYPALPMSPYGISKLATEKYLEYYHQTFNISTFALRFSNVYGARQNPKSESGVVAIFCSAVLAGRAPVIFGNGKQTRDFLYVNDAVRACMLAMKSNKNGIYNIATAKETSVNALLDVINKKSDSRRFVAHVPAKQGDQQRSSLSYAKAKKELGWRPEYTVKEGIKKTIQWYQSNQ